MSETRKIVDPTSKRCCGPDGCGEGKRVTYSAPYLRYCIGDACMAWRETFVDSLTPGDGYCGLAGKSTKVFVP